MLHQSGNIDSIRVIKAAIVFSDTNNRVALRRKDRRRIRADVAESLHDHPAALDLHPQMLQRLIAYDRDATPRSLLSPSRAANVDRLARHHGSAGLPRMHGVGIHNPRHGLLIGTHIGRRNILFGADELYQFGGVAPSHPLQLSLRHLSRIADDAALRPAEGNIHDSALPSHPTGQRSYLVERNIRRIAHTTLAGAPCNGMLNTIAGKDLNRTIVHADGNINRDLAHRQAQDLHNPRIKIELFRGNIESSGLRLPRIGLLLDAKRLHDPGPLLCWLSQRCSSQTPRSIG